MPAKKKTLSPLKQLVSTPVVVRPHRHRLTLGLIVLLVVLGLAFPFRFLVVPAVVNGQPIFSWDYIKALHKKAGQQVLDQMVNEMLVNQEVTKQGVQITQAEIDAQVKTIEDQIGTASGGLDSLLSAQGLDRTEFLKQIKLQLSLEKLVKGTIQVTPDEISQELKVNTSAYKGLSKDDATTKAAAAVQNQKMQQAFTTWFDDLKSKAKVLNFFITPVLSLPKI